MDHSGWIVSLMFLLVFLWIAYGVPKEFLCILRFFIVSVWCSMVFLRFACGFPDFLWFPGFSYVFCMGFTWFSFGFPMVSIWISHGWLIVPELFGMAVSYVCPMGFYDFCTVFLCISHGFCIVSL